MLSHIIIITFSSIALISSLLATDMSENISDNNNAFPQPQRRLHIWYYDLVLEDFISLIDVFSDVFRRGTASHHRKTSP